MASFITLIFFAGAKVQPFFHSTKYFLKYFFLLFMSVTPLSKAGAKLQQVF
ncbi:hypothetical protein CAPGI0001_1404 [Capnocytophaga gingivalis ATCC 33624]|nr:hypothetical protein CAPGI0001_1404 [Capnocytophaga gingivalis ATCC 33624]